MKKKLRWAVVIVIVGFCLLQLHNPPHTNPPVTSDMIAATKPPPEVANLLVNACYDCHSHETKWPWYSHVAPMSWLVVGDVNDGRHNLDLSEWPTNDFKRASRRLGDMGDNIASGDMPPGKYTAIHANARLTASQRKTLTDWLDAETDKMDAAAK